MTYSKVRGWLTEVNQLQGPNLTCLVMLLRNLTIRAIEMSPKLQSNSPPHLTIFSVEMFELDQLKCWDSTEGTVHRQSAATLAEYLPPKFEYVLSVKLSDIQRRLYLAYLKSAGHDPDPEADPNAHEGMIEAGSDASAGAGVDASPLSLIHI